MSCEGHKNPLSGGPGTCGVLFCGSLIKVPQVGLLCGGLPALPRGQTAGLDLATADKGTPHLWTVALLAAAGRGLPHAFQVTPGWVLLRLGM